MKITFSPLHWGNVTDSFKVENRIKNKRHYKIKIMYSFTQKMTCGNSPSMLFCMWEGNLGSENIDQLMKDIEVFPKQAEKKSKNNSKIHYPSFCVFIYFYIFPGEKWHRPQVWGSLLPFSPFGLEELYSHGSAYAVVCFSL